jgi:hypothetical protein
MLMFRITRSAFQFEVKSKSAAQPKSSMNAIVQFDDSSGSNNAPLAETTRKEPCLRGSNCSTFQLKALHMNPGDLRTTPIAGWVVSWKIQPEMDDGWGYPHFTLKSGIDPTEIVL